MNWKQWYETLRQTPADTWDASAWMAHLDAPSGFEREEAIRALTRLRAPEALPGLLKRLNDWVPQVRVAAQDAIHVYLDDALLAAWPAALPEMVHLLRGRRSDPWPMLSAIGNFFAQSDRVRALVADPSAIPALDPLVARWVFGIKWNVSDDAVRQTMLLPGMDGADILEALWAVGQTGKLASLAARTALWLKACGSPHGLVRAQALAQLCDSVPDVGAATAQRLALDRNAGVRSVALAQMRKTGGIELTMDLALTQLHWPSRAPRGAVPAFQFLASVDHAGAAAQAEQLMARAGEDRPGAALRALALRQLIASSNDDARDAWLLHALRDPSSRVQRVAVSAIEDGASAPRPDQLWPLMLGHGTSGAFQRGLRIQQHWGIWTQLDALLKLLRSVPTGATPDSVLEALERWMDTTRRGVAPPAEPEASVLRAAWSACENAMPSILRRRMDFELGCIGLLPLPSRKNA